ncbi:MAG: hypothetical protein V2A74_12785, partial [bacterium]
NRWRDYLAAEVLARIGSPELMDDDDHILQSYIGRAQSPQVECAVQDQLAAAFRELLETRGIYQNITLPTAFLEPFADDNYNHDTLIAEFRKRPIYPCSRGEGNDGNMREFAGRLGSDRLGTLHDEMSLGFYLPNIHTACAECGKETTHLSMICSGEPYLGSPYPIIAESTEQVFHLFYRCGNCRNRFLAFLVLRRGLKLQLVGRSVPFRAPLAEEWPKSVRAIVQDANAAASENDLPAAYYHLRTAIEFLIRSELHIDVNEKRDGNELCRQYTATLDDRLKQGFPSLAAVYSTLSAGLHSRRVTKEEYDKQFGDILNHLRAKGLFSEYG